MWLPSLLPISGVFLVTGRNVCQQDPSTGEQTRVIDYKLPGNIYFSEHGTWGVSCGYTHGWDEPDEPTPFWLRTSKMIPMKRLERTRMGLALQQHLSEIFEVVEKRFVFFWCDIRLDWDKLGCQASQMKTLAARPRFSGTAVSVRVLRCLAFSEFVKMMLPLRLLGTRKYRNHWSIPGILEIEMTRWHLITQDICRRRTVWCLRPHPDCLAVVRRSKCQFKLPFLFEVLPHLMYKIPLFIRAACWIVAHVRLFSSIACSIEAKEACLV